MSTLAGTYLTLAEVANRLDPNGKIAKIVEILAQQNPIIQHMPAVEGNLPTGHRTTIRTGLPDPTWRMLYQGTQPSKSQTIQVTDAIGQATNYLKVDKTLADMNGNRAEFMLSESAPVLEGFNQAVAETIFYGDLATAPAKFHGLGARYPYSDAPNVISAGGSGSDNTSIWLVVWGPNTVHSIYPKGSKAGLDMQDQGQKTVTESDGSMWEAYQAYFEWNIGLCVRDWRYVVRIANVDTGTWSSDLLKYMTRALRVIPSLRMGRPYFYMNREVAAQLDILSMSASNHWITQSNDPAGYPVTKFQGVPVEVCDSILSTEDALTATP